MITELDLPYGEKRGDLYLMKLSMSERKVMEVLWVEGEATAKQLAGKLNTVAGWSKTTSYTVIKKCISKGAIERIEPHFLCRPLITKEQIQAYETEELIDKTYNGNADELVASIIQSKRLTPNEIERLKRLVEEL